MATHDFEPTHFHVTIGSHEPVLRIASGDTVRDLVRRLGRLRSTRERRSPTAAIHRRGRSSSKAPRRATRSLCTSTASSRIARAG